MLIKCRSSVFRINDLEQFYAISQKIFIFSFIILIPSESTIIVSLDFEKVCRLLFLTEGVFFGIFLFFLIQSYLILPRKDGPL